MRVRAKSEDDVHACVDLLIRVHEGDGYPLYLPGDVPGFITPESEMAAWVAEHDDRIVGHVAVHSAVAGPTLVAAQRATRLPVERLAVVSRLFTAPEARRAGVGRALLQRATGHARSQGRRALLDVGRTLTAPVALYESEGWTRGEPLVLRIDENAVLDLWLYVSPEAGYNTGAEHWGNG